MELEQEQELEMTDNLNKCRCCFRTLIDSQKVIKITKFIEKNFFDLTQIKVANFSSSFS